MIRALTTSATGLEAQQANIEQISNDLANVNTDGYKRSRNEFQDLMYETIKEPGAQIGAGSQSPVGIQTGMGVKIGGAHKIFEPGPSRVTYRPYDLMIEGKGFFPVELANGEVGYVRTGAFHKDAQGRVRLTNGGLLQPQINVPSNAVNILFSPNGEVKVQLPSGEEATLGQIQLINFENEEGLLALGDGVYKPSKASGGPLPGIPGENGNGIVQQGALEAANVNVANSMVDMIRTQRGYEMGTKVMKTVDEMLGYINAIK